MQPYSAYLDSGLEWLGEVPEHCEVRPFRHVCRLAYGDSLASEAREIGDVPVFGSNGVVGEHDTPNTLAPAIVIGRKGSYGEVNFSDSEAFAIDTTYFVDQRYTTSDLRWLFYTLLSADLADVSKDSAIPGLSREDAYEKRLPVPPLDEQRDIAAFLDRETERTDSLMRKKRLLIERLQEYRTALITRTVTRGLPPEAARAADLDPSPRLKASGVEWLGDIPEHWDVSPFKRVCSLAYGDSLPAEARNQDGDIAVFGSNGAVGRHDVPNTNGPVIVVGRKGSHGEVNFSSSPVFAIDTTYFVDDRFTSATIRWLFHALGSADLADFSKDSAVPGLARDDAYEKHLPLPPAEEQAAIADYLDAESQRIDELVGRIGEATDRLHEYRTALITAAVTGKIDVRGAATSGRGSVESRP